MKTECQGLFGRLFGHHFVGQYNTTPPASMNWTSGSVAAMRAVAESFTTKTYVCAVCVRCGEKR